MIYTSDLLESLEIETFEDLFCEDTVSYQLTPGELGWLDFIGRNYTISDYILSNLAGDVWTLRPEDVSEALTADGIDRPPCLKEDTQLCRLIWYIGPEGE